MPIVERMIKRNQRLMLLKRQSIRAIRRGGRILQGAVDVTPQVAAELRRQIGDLLAANTILRDHLQHA